MFVKDSNPILSDFNSFEINNPFLEQVVKIEITRIIFFIDLFKTFSIQ